MYVFRSVLALVSDLYATHNTIQDGIISITAEIRKLIQQAKKHTQATRTE